MVPGFKTLLKIALVVMLVLAAYAGGYYAYELTRLPNLPSIGPHYLTIHSVVSRGGFDHALMLFPLYPMLYNSSQLEMKFEGTWLEFQFNLTMADGRPILWVLDENYSSPGFANGNSSFMLRAQGERLGYVYSDENQLFGMFLAYSMRFLYSVNLVETYLDVDDNGLINATDQLKSSRYEIHYVLSYLNETTLPLQYLAEDPWASQLSVPRVRDNETLQLVTRGEINETNEERYARFSAADFSSVVPQAAFTQPWGNLSLHQGSQPPTPLGITRIFRWNETNQWSLENWISWRVPEGHSMSYEIFLDRLFGTLYPVAIVGGQERRPDF